ncbi:hypothetical protein GCM10011338_16340 [Alteromonas lipolytica]|uniref:Transglycosylase SLT domain-containing protein n=1 Tax=Alteromonas lipolytica TaxID=1856405 RepID=A0A1E8FAB3_9ALTE|nr:hypothetical protein BFC17_00875 [Alteromonas lipolytica]GGF64675.1 hypothetical protein GCM10011338_16340 [Alteromonas lipolytica]
MLTALSVAFLVNVNGLPEAAAQTKLTAEQQAFKERRQKELDAFQLKRMQQFAQFKARYNAKLESFRAKLLEQWGEVDVSDEDTVVVYPEPEVKTVVDYEEKKIVVSVLHDANATLDKERVVKALEQLKSVEPEDGKGEAINILKSYAANDTFDDLDKLVNNAEIVIEQPEITEEDLEAENQAFESRQQQDAMAFDMMADKLSSPAGADKVQSKVLSQSEKSHSISINKVNRDRSRNADALKNKRITRLTIAIKPKELQDRIAEVTPYAKQYSAALEIPVPLIVAMIHTESSFNPLAVSHIPAYGLMQVVPTSAGIDVNEFLHSKREPLKKDYLFIADQNVEAGSAYLHLLNNRYLAKISNPQTRLYCAIAAYNTGVGNVTRAFTSGQTTKMSDSVAAEINAMEPQQAYELLLEKLPYEETRKYLKKVRTRMDKYRNI